MDIQVINPYKNYQFWYKGQTHVHSNLVTTDSQDEAYNVEKTYHDRGYDFICLTDHDHGFATGRLFPTEDPWAHGILHIRSAESGWEDRHHMLYLGIDRSRAIKKYDELLRGVPDCDAHEHGTIQERIDYARATGSLCVLAHPTAGESDHFSQFRYIRGNTGYAIQELSMNSGYTGIEILSGDIWSIEWWDYALRLGKDRVAWGFAGDDCENLKNRNDFNRGWIVVNSSVGSAREYLDGPREDELRQDILENIRMGNFYAVVRSPGLATCRHYGIADRGPELSFSVTGAKITVTTDQLCQSIRFLPDGASVPDYTRAEVASYDYTVRGREIYVRVEVEQIRSDGEVYRAFSQPFYIVNQ